VKVNDLPESERFQIQQLIWQEGMGLPFDVSMYKICPSCKRIFDGRWFSHDWEMKSRWCACGYGLERPWNLSPADICQAAKDLRQDVVPHLRQFYTDEELSKLFGGYVEILYREGRMREDAGLFLCRNCYRVYMWVPVKSYQVFQCVSVRYDKYDRGPIR
jgi:hypothetical protein